MCNKTEGPLWLDILGKQLFTSILWSQHTTVYLWHEFSRLHKNIFNQFWCQISSFLETKNTVDYERDQLVFPVKITGFLIHIFLTLLEMCNLRPFERCYYLSRYLLQTKGRKRTAVMFCMYRISFLSFSLMKQSFMCVMWLICYDLFLVLSLSSDSADISSAPSHGRFILATLKPVASALELTVADVECIETDLKQTLARLHETGIYHGNITEEFIIIEKQVGLTVNTRWSRTHTTSSFLSQKCKNIKILRKFCPYMKCTWPMHQNEYKQPLLGHVVLEIACDNFS